MRNAFAEAVFDCAELDDRIVLLSGDIGNRLFNRFKERFPGRFYNCGVAEANMVSMAAGMASCGLRPICYTIAPFLTYRAMEQIRVDLAYHKVPVTLVGTGSGLSYSELGSTHHSLEEVAMLRTIPEMRILAPGDPWEVKALLPVCIQEDGPVYMRIGKKGEPCIHKALPQISIGSFPQLRKGSDVCFLAVGNLLPVAMKASEVLEQEGVSCEVVSCCSLKPLDFLYLKQAFARFDLLVSMEEHGKTGGAGSAILEYAHDHGLDTGRLIRLGTPDLFFHEVWSQQQARKLSGLDLDSVVSTCIKRKLTRK